MNGRRFEVKRRFDCDVLVVGGGTAGIAAAIAAARGGRRVILVESRGFLGGNSVNIPAWLGFHACSGERLVGGIALELQRKLRAAGGATPFYRDPICGSLTGINTHLWKIAAFRETREAGVESLLHTRFAGLEKQGRTIRRAFLFGGEGLLEVSCRFVIDCTDAGTVAREAGELLTRGRATDGRVQASSWTFEVGNIDFGELFAYFRRHPDDLRPFPLPDAAAHIDRIEREEAFVMGAFGSLIARSGMRLPRTNMPGIAFPRERRMVSVAVRVADVDPDDSPNYSRAEAEGALQVPLWLEFLRREAPGFQNCVLSGSPDAIGVRETSHLAGEYVLTGADLMAGKTFDDAIARGGYHLDIHSPDHGGLETRQPPVFTIPFRSLLPRETDNLLVAGRALSATHEAQAAIRVIPIGMAIGEAAGTAAARAAKPEELRAEPRCVPGI